MKKYISILLIAAALFTSCSSSEAESETTAETETAAETVLETETAPLPPEQVEIFEYYELETAKEPVMENGILVVYFTEDDIRYTADSRFYIGVRGEDSSYSINASSQAALYPDMLTDAEKNYYNGIALLPAEEIPAGEYKMSVTFEEFIVNFDITIQ